MPCLRTTRGTKRMYVAETCPYAPLTTVVFGWEEDTVQRTMVLNLMPIPHVLLVLTDPPSSCQTSITLHETQSPNQISKTSKHTPLGIGSVSGRCSHQHGCTCHNDIWLELYSGRLAAKVDT